VGAFLGIFADDGDAVGELRSTVLGSRGKSPAMLDVMMVCLLSVIVCACVMLQVGKLIAVCSDDLIVFQSDPIARLPSWPSLLYDTYRNTS